ncbi:hypothetical protein FKM82_025830 [Ascaphus truei]
MSVTPGSQLAEAQISWSRRCCTVTSSSFGRVQKKGYTLYRATNNTLSLSLFVPISLGRYKQTKDIQVKIGSLEPMSKINFVLKKKSCPNGRI